MYERTEYGLEGHVGKDGEGARKEMKRDGEKLGRKCREGWRRDSKESVFRKVFRKFLKEYGGKETRKGHESLIKEGIRN